MAGVRRPSAAAGRSGCASGSATRSKRRDRSAGRRRPQRNVEPSAGVTRHEAVALHEPRQRERLRAGNTISKTVRPGRLATEIAPPCRSTIAFTIDNPRPLPPDLTPGPRRVRLVEAIEDVRQVLRRDARGAFVLDRQRDAAVDRRCAASRSVAAARRVADGVGGQILQRLLEPIAIAGDRAPRPARSTVASVTPRRCARALVPRGDAVEQLRRPARRSICSVPPPPSSRARSSRSPIIRSSRARFVADDRQVARRASPRRASAPASSAFRDSRASR